MSSVEKSSEPRATSTADAAKESKSLLTQAIEQTKQTTSDRAKELLKTFTEMALANTVSFDSSLTKSINTAISEIDRKISMQLSAVMQHPDFKKLEGSWRGLKHLVMKTETDNQLMLRVFNCTKRELEKDFDKATDFDKSTLWTKIYETEFGTPGGKPYGALIGDFEFDHRPGDVSLLRSLSQVAAGAFCPFISAASANMFGLDDWTDLGRPPDIAKIFQDPEYIDWNSFRATEDSRFVTLTLPRTLARLPYGRGKHDKAIDEFNFEEFDYDEPLSKEDAKDDEKLRLRKHKKYCWMNTAYVFGTRLTDAFKQTGWCTAIRGAENGGKVESLPTHVVASDEGDKEQKCPTEVSITDRREKELSDCGFLPLSHYKGENYAVFFGGQTTQKPKVYYEDQATENAAISARLPYIMATSRIAHYLKCIARDKVGAFLQASDAEKWLNSWIKNYVIEIPTASAHDKARKPLRDARVEVSEIPGKPGAYNAVAYLRPWLQMEELNASLRLVTEIPKKKA